MKDRVLNLRNRNLLGRILAGALFILLGVLRIAGISGPISLAFGTACFAVLLLSLYAELSRKRQLKDEMYWSNAGRAAYSAFVVDAIVFCLIAMIGLHEGIPIDLCGAASVALGLTEFTNGIFLAHLERGGEYADD